jgi:two-component system sensor histidine kinase UhpB
MEVLNPLRDKYRHLSIFNQVLVGNSAVIIVGAVVGTIVTRHLSALGDLKLIALFSILGILLVLLVNYWIIKFALEPLRELRNIVTQVRLEQLVLDDPQKSYKDQDIQELVEAVNAMLRNLASRTYQLRTLSERAINAQEEERKRIARLLHDDTAQSISTLIIHLEQIENSLSEAQSDLRERIKKERLLATEILEELRKNIWDLRPSILDDLGLAPAIRWYARTKLKEQHIQVEFQFNDETKPLGGPNEILLFRIMQEAVSNILHHSKASKVAIRLCQDGNQICFEVEDNGLGFDVSETEGLAFSRKQFGLLGIRERTSLVGGSFEVQSSPGTGTHLYVCVPLREETAMNAFQSVPQMETEMQP